MDISNDAPSARWLTIATRSAKPPTGKPTRRSASRTACDQESCCLSTSEEDADESNSGMRDRAGVVNSDSVQGNNSSARGYMLGTSRKEAASLSGV
jgi:hypothetical protein